MFSDGDSYINTGNVLRRICDAARAYGIECVQHEIVELEYYGADFKFMAKIADILYRAGLLSEAFMYEFHGMV